MSSWTIRPAEDRDLPAASELLERCGWRDPNRLQTLSFISKSPSGNLLVAEAAGELLGVIGALHFGQTGWASALGVDPDTRGDGMGTRLCELTMEWLLDQGVRTIFCFVVTPQGRRVAEIWDFEEEDELVFGWVPALDGSPAGGDGSPGDARPLRPEDLGPILALDREATGEDRSGFLSAAVGHGGALIEGDDGELLGFDIYCRWGPGPTVARTPEVGLRLIETRRRKWGGPRVLMLPVANEAAFAGLPGGQWPMRFRRWRRGAPVPRRPDMQFGLCNFYWG